MQLGHKLKRIREEKKISQEEISYHLEISQKTYSNIEADKTTPSIIQLSKLAELLEIDILELLKEQGIIFNQSNNEFKNDNGSYIINNLSKKLIEQYESRIKIKQELISFLKEKIANLTT